jgi:hypothetical protein
MPNERIFGLMTTRSSSLHENELRLEWRHSEQGIVRTAKFSTILNVCGGQPDSESIWCRANYYVHASGVVISSDPIVAWCIRGTDIAVQICAAACKRRHNCMCTHVQVARQFRWVKQVSFRLLKTGFNRSELTACLGAETYPTRPCRSYIVFAASFVTAVKNGVKSSA